MKQVTHHLNIFRLSLSGAILFYCLAEISLNYLGLEKKYGAWESVAALVGQIVAYTYLFWFVPKPQLVAIEGR